MEIGKKIARLARWQYFWLCLIVIVSVALHISVITRPPELVLDEQHYIPDARSIIEKHEDPRPEHPTLAKLIIAGGLLVFGDNPVGWRAPAVIFGTLNIILFYLICQHLHMSRRATNLATFLLGFENMSFIQASVAMLDVFFLTFMLASFWLYLRKNYSLSAIALALSVLSKLTGVLGAGAIGLHWLVMNRKTLFERNWRPFADFAASMLLAPFSFFVFMPVFDYIAINKFSNPVSRVVEMMSLMSTLTFATTQHDSLSRPWEWLISPKPMPYWYVPSYMGGISYTVWALIIPSVMYLAYRMWKGSSAAIFAFWWFVFTYMTWIPISILTDRISFVFYFYPTIPAICIGLGLGFSHLLNFAGEQKNVWHWLIPATIGAFMIGHLTVLAIVSPVFT